MVQVGFGGANIAPVIVTGPNPAEAVSRRVQDQQSSRPVRETEETDEGNDRQGPTTLVASDERSDEIRARNAADEDEIRAAQEERRREAENREPRPGDRVDVRV